MERFKNKVLLLDESNFEQVKKLLINKKLKVANRMWFSLSEEKHRNFLIYDDQDEEFMIGNKFERQVLTLEEFINLLNS